MSGGVLRCSGVLESLADHVALELGERIGCALELQDAQLGEAGLIVEAVDGIGAQPVGGVDQRGDVVGAEGCQRVGRQAAAIGERLRVELAEPMLLESGPLVVTCSVGVARATGDDSVDGLLHNADVAMYEAKRRGKGATAVFGALPSGQG